MKPKKFWNWKTVTKDSVEERILTLDGPIAEESWFDDEVTPQDFKNELLKGNGPITVWINSPGGDCIAAAQIYNMLREYKNKVVVKIDGIAASAASVIAMAGDEVLMSPVANMMIHNPLTGVWGNKQDLEKAEQMLDSVKESIMNAYENKTGMKRDKISDLMDAETWMDANMAIDLGFADGVIERNKQTEDEENNLFTSKNSKMFSRKAVAVALLNKVVPPAPKTIVKDADVKDKQNEATYSADELLKDLEKRKNKF